MTKTFLLDTSSYRALSATTMKKLRSLNIRLVTSPYCFWELLTHLDEKEQFDRFKGRFMNFKFLEILDDPLAQIELSLGVKDNARLKRVPDTDIVYGALAALREARDLEQFYASYVKDSNGELRLLRESAERTRKILENEERRFVSFVEDFVSALRDGTVRIEKDEEFQRAFFDLVNGEVQVLESRGADGDELRYKVIEYFYFYFSVILRLAEYYHKNRTFKVNWNDYEDSRIVLHLALNTPYNFVTGDIKLFSILEEIQKFSERYPLNGFVNHLNIFTTNHLRNIG